jgi:hypothetical protein
MAQKTPSQTPPKTSSSALLFALVAGIAGWALPGLGHLLLRRWGRAAVYFLGVGSLALAGFLLRGNVFAGDSADPFDTLGYLADLGAGAFYFLARSLDGAADVSRAAGDYGTRFFATAGVLNLVCALEAFEIASGRKA